MPKIYLHSRYLGEQGLQSFSKHIFHTCHCNLRCASSRRSYLQRTHQAKPGMESKNLVLLVDWEHLQPCFRFADHERGVPPSSIVRIRRLGHPLRPSDKNKSSTLTVLRRTYRWNVSTLNYNAQGANDVDWISYRSTLEEVEANALYAQWASHDIWMALNGPDITLHSKEGY